MAYKVKVSKIVELFATDDKPNKIEIENND